MRFIKNYYRWLFDSYNKVGFTMVGLPLVRNADGSYRRASKRAAIAGFIGINAYFAFIAWGNRRIGRQQGYASGYEDGRKDIVMNMDDKTYKVWSGHGEDTDDDVFVPKWGELNPNDPNSYWNGFGWEELPKPPSVNN